MKFSARSYSPSPVRGKYRSSSTFGIQSDSDSEDYSDSDLNSSSDGDDDSVSIVSDSSSDKSLLVTSDLKNLAIRPNHAGRSPLEVKYIEETVAAIRSRARYYDPYEEWEKQTRRDAFKTARKELSKVLIKHDDEQAKLDAEVALKLEEIHARQVSEVDRVLAVHRQRQQVEDMKLKEVWKAKERQLWERLESVIKVEEDKVAKKLEEERKKLEEEERKRKEEELKKRLAEEKRLLEEEEKRKVEEEKRKQEEEKVRLLEEEEKRREQMEEDKKRRLAEEIELRRMLAFNSADDDWRVARENLIRLKSGPMRFVKGDKTLKSEWSNLRRQIVPKIGQLTNDAEAITQITQQIIGIVRPANPHRHESIYIALLSSLSKCILLQAETEVTAEKRSAIPLAQVTFNLLDTLEHFPSIFFAKLVQRCGAWPIPTVVPPVDIDAKPWSSQDLYRKICGFRKSESGEGVVESLMEYSNRVSSLMRVYFHVLKIRPMRQPLDPMFQLPRYWTWFARMVGDLKLLAEPIAPQLIYTALDVMGAEAGLVWGKQWMKALALIYEGITSGYDGGRLIGGDTAEASAARTRVMLSLESIVEGNG